MRIKHLHAYSMGQHSTTAVGAAIIGKWTALLISGLELVCMTQQIIIKDHDGPDTSIMSGMGQLRKQCSRYMNQKQTGSLKLL